MANNQKKLKAFVRYDGSGRVVASSLILRKNKPRVGRWYEIPEYLCCNGTTNTTTTQGGVTPTAFIKSYWTSVSNACNSTTEGSLLFYSSSSTLDIGTAIFTDASLTVPVTQGWVINIGGMSPSLAVAPGGVLSQYTCPTTYSYNVYAAFSESEACNNTGGSAITVYSNDNSLATGVTLFLNSSLTTPYDAAASGYTIKYNNNKYSIAGNVVQNNGISCNVDQANGIAGSSPGNVCANIGTTVTLYYSNMIPLGVNTLLYMDAGLTVPYNSNVIGNYINIYFQGQPQMCTISGNTLASYTAC